MIPKGHEPGVRMGRGGLFICLAGLNGALGVIGGALGAHGDQIGHGDWLTPLIDTASRFQLVHAAALLGVGVMVGQGFGRLAVLAGLLFLIGCLLFSGGLYANGFWHWRLGAMVAPWGGTSFILGWLVLAVAGLRRA